MSLFRLDSSIRQDGSVSRSVADTLERAWLAEHPEGTVVRRDVAAQPVPAELWADAAIGGRTPADQRTPAQTAALATAASYADEVIAADTILIGTALYNFGVSQHLKAWIDILITDPRLGPAAGKALEGRKAVLVVARGGGYGPGTPRDGWDHATGWLRRILVDVWGLDLEIIEAELTLAPYNPAMAELVELSQQLQQAAHDTAAEHGARLGRQSRVAA